MCRLASANERGNQQARSVLPGGWQPLGFRLRARLFDPAGMESPGTSDMARCFRWGARVLPVSPKPISDMFKGAINGSAGTPL